MTMVFVGILGVILGSFINVLIDRTIIDCPIIKPRSYCDICLEELKIYNLIPIISYIFQKGHCTNCNKKIKLQYPLVEILTGINFIWYYILIDNFIKSIIISTIIALFFSMAVIDYKTKYIYISHIVVLFLLNILLINRRYWMKVDIIYKIVYILILILIGFLLSKKNLAGFGDFLILGIISINMYFNEILAFFIVLSIIGLILGVVLVIKNKDIKYEIPFVPIIFLAYIVILNIFLINNKFLN